MKLNILCIGDIVGRPGRHILSQQLSTIISEYKVDCVIANAENAAGGSGLTSQIYDKLLKYGVNLITLGDHVYRKRDIISTLETSDKIVRPANLSDCAAGSEYAIYQTAKGPTVAIVTLIGRVFMKPADCPYAKIDDLISKLSGQVDIIIVEVHAEATSEKIAMGYYLDGKVSCVFGTHTHVTTADEKVLPKGTAYITDIGMTGSHDSVLGRKTQSVIKAFRTQMPFPFEIATEDVRISGILVTIDSNAKTADSIQRIQIMESAPDSGAGGYDSDDGKPDYCNGF
jgi:2',3'-cyclic-nucleotide 2'-phosphodiesterase